MKMSNLKLTKMKKFQKKVKITVKKAEMYKRKIKRARGMKTKNSNVSALPLNFSPRFH
jgi:hypothetical protein